VRGQGAYLWTAGGRRLVDYFLSHGTTVVGHGDPAVNDAAALAAACCGRTGVGLQRGEVELAEQIAAWLPSAEKVAFVARGGEALRQAIEVSRAATGRHRILTSDIGDPGAPTAFARHGREVAAVVVAPYLHGAAIAAPGSAFLEQMRELATRHRSLLVLDERETAFRHHLGAYQAIIGVSPDLPVLGEAMANGHSIGALAGRRDLIDGFTAPGGGCEPWGPHPYAFARAAPRHDPRRARGCDCNRQWPNVASRLGRRRFRAYSRVPSRHARRRRPAPALAAHGLPCLPRHQLRRH
jgi:glutamate-1-semialdehyde 2,1-aminomutase